MEQNKEIKHEIVQTYAEDMAKVIEGDKSGLIKKIIHGEEEHEKEKMALSPESRKNKLFMLISLLFTLLGLAVLFFFLFKKEVPATVPIEKQFIPLIFNDTSTSVEVSGLDKDKIIQAVYNIVSTTNVKMSGVAGIYLLNNKKNVGLREFVKIIKGNFVPGDNTLFVNDDFLLGVVNGQTKDFFILLKTRSSADIFDPLRAWENKMFSDLHGFFGVNISSDTNYLSTSDFSDGIIENKNARILYDKNNKIVMMYIFVDDNSVVITNTESAAHEIMLRLAASHVKK